MIRRVAAAAVVSVLVFAAPALAQAGPSVYWGANIGDHLTGGSPPYDMTAADQFEQMVGKQMGLIEYSLPWADCSDGPCQDVPFPATQMQAIRDRGALPVFGWASYSQPMTPAEPDFKLSTIINGSHDAYIRQWAQDARNWGGPFFLVFNWEMNLKGIWPYGEADNGNQAGEYVQAWRHVHDIFAAEGANNATWVWCPNTMYDSWSSQIARYYPGDGYVDWTCIDGYKWPWLNWSFGDLIGPTYDSVQAVAPAKPVLIGETAAAETIGSKSAWITNAFGTLTTRFPNIKGLVWFEKIEPGLAESPNNSDPRSWLVESSPSSLAAFRAAIASPVFAGPGVGTTSGKIAPLTPVIARPGPLPGPSPDPTPDPGPGPGPAPKPAPSCWDKPLSTKAACRRGPMITALKAQPKLRRTLGHTAIGATHEAAFRFRVRSDGWLTVQFQRRTSRRRWKAVKGKIVLPVTAGRRGLSFSGRIAGRRTLQTGRYRVLFGGRDRSGRHAKVITARFVLLKPPHHRAAKSRRR